MGNVSGPASFQRQPRDEKGKKAPGAHGGGKKWGIVGLAFLILLGTGGAIYAFMQREDPEVAEIRELIDEGRGGEEMTDEERRAHRQQVRERMEQLDEEQQAAVWEATRPEREAHMRERQEQMHERIAHFYELSAEEQTAYLDERIDEMVAQREEWEKRREEREREREAQGESGGEGRGEGRGGGGGPQAEGGDRPRRDPEARRERHQQHRRDRLADTTPEQRAQWANYREQLRQRMEERGIEGGWGRGGPGGGRGPR